MKIAVLSFAAWIICGICVSAHSEPAEAIESGQSAKARQTVADVSEEPSLVDADTGRQANGLPIGFCCAEELTFIPEVDSWERCDLKAYPEAASQAHMAWLEEAKRIGKYVTPDLARRLSRWAKKEMEGYRKVPSLEKIAFQPVAHYPNGNRVVLKGTVDTLPTHSPVVTRWLQVYVLWDITGKSIERVTVTIRGERLE
jgi:hypothetical protein